MEGVEEYSEKGNLCRDFRAPPVHRVNLHIH